MATTITGVDTFVVDAGWHFPALQVLWDTSMFEFIHIGPSSQVLVG